MAGVAEGIDRSPPRGSLSGRSSLRHFHFSILAWLFTTPVLAAYQAGGDVLWTDPIDSNLYLAGDSVRLHAPAGADVAAAGGRVIIQQRVGGDLLAAGGQVEVRGTVDDDVRVAAGQVRLGSAIAGEAIAAGGHVWLQPEARVGGRAWFAGSSVDVDGHVAGELRVAGKEVTIAGIIDGDALVHADTLRILPGARIGGRLDYRSSAAAEIAPDASIAGPVKHHQSDSPPIPVRAPVWVSMLWGIAVVTVTAIVYVLAVPRFAIDAADTLGERPWASLGLGIAVLFATPPVAILSMVTVLGALVGLVLLLLYVLMLLLGFFTGILFVGRTLLLRPIGRAGSGSILLSITASIVATLLLALLMLIPVAGTVLVTVVLISGLGAVTLRLFRVRQSQMLVER